MQFLTRSTPFASAASRRVLQQQTGTTCTTQIRLASRTAAAEAAAPPASLLRKSVEGKHVIVTGSSQGIGRFIALRLASDGYNVCINDIPANEKACEEVVKEIRSLGRKACYAVADVSKRSDVKDLVQKSVKELGPLHTM